MQIGALQPDEKPRPTVYMPQIIKYVGDLVEKGAAYVVDGDVYLKVRDIPGYGELSGNTIDSLESGARIDVNDKKKIRLISPCGRKQATGSNGIVLGARAGRAGTPSAAS
jgi:cysteinyl-tRNA synthetase